MPTLPSDCIVFDALVRHPRVKVWQLVGDPEMYPRFFRGITDCTRIGSSEPNVPTRYRFTLELCGAVIQHTVQTVLNRNSEKLALANDPDNGSWCSVNLVDDGPWRTRVSLSFFKPALCHDNTRWSKSDVRAWARDGMQRVCDFLDRTPTSIVANRGDAATFQVSVVNTLRTAGVLTLAQPNKGIAQLRAVGKWGHTLVGGYIGAAARSPQDLAVVDQHGTRTFAEVDSASTRLAAGLRTLGIEEDSAVAVLARNHAVMVETLLACGKLGTNVVLLNVGLAGQQLVNAIKEHGAEAVIADDEFDAMLRYLPDDVLRISTSRRASVSASKGIDDLLRDAHDVHLRPPRRPGTLVVMTSGTSGTPKGARRPTPKGLGVVAAMLSRLPLRTGERMFIAAPLFHSWGLAALQISTPLRATVLLQERFDAETCLRAIAEHRATSLFAIPIMLRRIMNLPAEVRERYDTSSLRVVASSGSAMSGALVTEFMAAYGDVLYNFYGSTEVSWGTIAGPDDLRAAPTTAGTPPLGTRVGILDDDGKLVPYGSVGRIFVGNEMLFDGYTDGGSKDIEDKLMDTGDVGYLDANGRLFVSGRQDEMIISGGENVFPRAVEEAIALLPQVDEVAVVGASDVEYGQRLVAYVVVREGARLDAELVRRYIRHRLPRFAVPRDVHFIHELPRNPTGKILKRLLVDGITYPHTPSA